MTLDSPIIVKRWFEASSLCKHSLGRLLELTTAVHVADVILGSGGAGSIGSCGPIVNRSVLVVDAGSTDGVCLVDEHALVLLGRGNDALVPRVLPSIWRVFRARLHARLLADHVQHRVFQSLLVLGEAILLPGVVKDAMVEAVA